MAHSTWQPKWWTNEHTSAWDRIKDAMKRDWEQTKSDVHVKGAKDLHQNVGDTVKQAAGKEAIPAASSWDDAEVPVRYGYGAAHHHKNRDWNGVESDLRSEWDSESGHAKQKWDDVKASVHRGFDRARS